MEEKDLKLLIKLKDPVTNEAYWKHLCYVDRTVYNNFSMLKDADNLNKCLSEWCKLQFDVDLPMDTNEDIEKLRDLVKEYYKDKYPEIYRDSTTDRQGWLRLWIVECMKTDVFTKG